MLPIRRLPLPLPVTLGLLFLTAGCSYFRGVPSHGGGKRFDEEERAVAGSIRRTVSSMDLAELEGKRTALVISSIFTSGSGTTDWSGLTSVSLSGNRTLGSSLQQQVPPPGSTTAYGFEQDNDTDNRTGALGVGYRPNSSYRAANQNTEGDLGYFRAALEMKARHNGLSIVTQNPEVLLCVLVDVLGTNHSRRDFILYANEELLACCEVTYYAVDVKTGKLVFKSRQAGSAAKYSEGSFFFVPASIVRRSVRYHKPVYFDTEKARCSADAGPIEVPEDLGEVRRVARQMAQDQQEELLRTLVDRARFHISAGNAEAANDNVQTIREIDPGYKGLGDLARELQLLAPPGK